ncbi:MAG TPA: YraN family protein [Chromatiaceae bacterium]|jgi:putative endonuclease|nr:YraN family protein [Chromatiaceae bacterium]HIN82163.1 YraN family protein [Chromatiales bacterium]HIA08726.1 YraN family protein [Chromatiaceae bacterium]HIB85584.1 YraN family protein [Chromatiaceae bacterium]HIO15017.1 YraN family protein [Chromatiales bacterium]
MSDKPTTLARGQQAETMALAFLQERGMRLLDRNYHCRFGEIDLILTHRDTLIFTEVRYRCNPLYGTAAESVGPSKQRRILITARHYLARHPQMNKLPARFDIIAIGPELKHEHLRWIPNAFQAD